MHVARELGRRIVAGIYELTELIEEENKLNPIDDQMVTDLLVKEGYIIARRTVSKYRAMLGIPKSKLRREIN